MKKIVLLLSIFTILIIGLYSCKSPKEVADEQPNRSFVIGSGGGFTGAYVSYRVNSNGEIEQKDGESYSFFKRIPADSAAVCFQGLDELALEGYTFHHPGNMSYFIEINSKTITWGSSNHSIRNDIDAFYKRSNQMIRADYNLSD